MRFRVGLWVLGLAAAGLLGCERPQAEFSYSQGTRDLMPAAGNAVRATLQENFGTPHKLVVWRDLPIRFGSYLGEVTEGGPVSETIRVNLVPSDDNVESASAEDGLTGAAVLWTSGELQGASYPQGEQEIPIDFVVDDYDAETGELKIKGSANVTNSVNPGDTFIIAGQTLQEGRKHYMQHCMHCHGVAGDGEGPTAEYLNPLPRDYRKGVFKFTSTLRPEKPTRDDLRRIIQHGIPGTYMPSFMLLPEKELDSITEYVIFLAMRGELEEQMGVSLIDYTRAALDQRIEGGESRDEIETELSEYLQEDFPEEIPTLAAIIGESWSRADDETSQIFPTKPRPPADTASLERGRKLYLGNDAKCYQCHGPHGKGNGTQTEDYQKIPGSDETYAVRGLHDDWGHPIVPRDLTTGIYRGGRRPLDVYRRIHAGIKGTPMAAFSTALTEDQIWDLVNYVMSIPFDGRPSPSPQSDDARVASAPGTRDGGGE